MDAPDGVDLSACATILDRSGRPKLLAHLKDCGITKLAERQAFANRIAKMVKSGELLASTEDAPDESPLVRLLRAAATGQDTKVSGLLADQPQQHEHELLRGVDAKGNSALMLAVHGGHEAVVGLILEHELPHGDSSSCKSNGAPMVSFLELRRPDDGFRAVHIAAKGRHHGCLRRLLSARADADATNTDSWSSLMIACECDDVETARLLLEVGGASPTLGVHNGYAIVLTPLKLACVNGHAECARRLLHAGATLGDDDGTKFDVVEADGSTMLIYAAQRTKHRTPLERDGHTDTVRLLLDAKALPDQTRWDGLTPLAYACMYGDTTSARHLLSAGASVSKADEAGWTPLLWAALHGHDRCVALLLSHRASPHEARPNGCTALMMSSLGGNAACVEVLLAAKADVAARKHSGARCSALMLAASHGHAACTRALLAAGASPVETDALGRSAYDHARSTWQRAAGGGGGANADADATMACLLTKEGEGCSAVVELEPPSVGGSTAAVGASEPLVRFGRIEGMSNLDSWQELVRRTPPDMSSEPPTAQGDGATATGGGAGSGSAGSAGGGGGGGSGGRGGDGTMPALRYHCSSTHPHFANLLQLLLLSHGFERSASLQAADWSLLWYAGQIDPMKLRALRPSQLCSKFPNSGCLTTKSQLWTTFERMQRKHGARHFGFVASSFVLPEQAADLEECMKAEARAEARGAVAEAERRGNGPRDAADAEGPAGAAQGDHATKGSGVAEGSGTTEGGGAAGSVWIVKPVASCRGQGITLHRSADGALPADVACRRGIASRYIHPPYLVDGRKVDLRLYVLVTSWRPLVLYLHTSGLARLATAAYSLSELGDASKHLTNYSINKYAIKEAAVRAEAAAAAGGDGAHLSGAASVCDGPKLSLEAFRAILEKDVGEARATEAWRRIDAAIAKCVLAAEPMMGSACQTYVPSNGCGCFQLFGFDVMLDASLNPWVIEVNLDPSLATDSPLDLEVKASVLTDLLNVVDASNPKREGLAPAVAARDDAAVVRLVDAELRRARGGGWQRLLPSSRSGEFVPFMEPSRAPLNELPFEV